MFWKSRSFGTAAGVLAVGLMTSGCFLDDDASYDEADFDRVREGLDEAAEGLGQAAEGLREALSEMAEEIQAGGMVDEPIDFRDLYAFLPEEMGDFTRTSREGKTEGAMGFDVSAVEAEYEREDGARIEVAIVDVGALPMVGSIVDWLDIDVDEENDGGWRRTAEFDGYPAMEEFRRTDGDRGRAEYAYFVEGRFLVALEGRDLTMDELFDVRDEIGTDDLADLRDEEGERGRRDRRDRGR